MALSRSLSRSMRSLAASKESLASVYSTTSQGIKRDPKPISTTKPRKQGTLPYSIRAACSGFSFLLMTIIYILDLGTDVWVVVVFIMDNRLIQLGFCIVIFAFTSIMIGFMYVFNIKKMQPDLPSLALALCMCINFPLHLGIMYERAEQQVYKFTLCCKRMADQHIVVKDWIFAKLKLAHATFQSGPLLIMNVVMILMYPNGHIANQAGALFSFLSLVFSASLHEVNRKHYQQDKVIGLSRVYCIFAYKTLTLAARMMAFANFAYFYQSYLAAIILCHVFIVFLYFIIVYRNVWKINLGRMTLHTIYCVFSYFPIHNDYRPEGEVLAYYVLYMIENIIMVALPFKVEPTADVNRQHMPGTVYYKAITVIILFGSAVGLVLMAVYYFCLHRERSTIRSDHFGYCCPPCWCCRKEKITSSPRRDPIYVNRSNATTQESRLTVPDTPVDNQPFLNEKDDAPPAYNELVIMKPPVPKKRTKPPVTQPTSPPEAEISYEDETKKPLNLSSSESQQNGERSAGDIGQVYTTDKEASTSMAAELEKLRAASVNKEKKKKLSNPFKKSKK